jgi:hypothetical protein
MNINADKAANTQRRAGACASLNYEVVLKQHNAVTEAVQEYQNGGISN